MYTYVVKTALALTCHTPETIRVWRTGSVIKFKVEAPAPRHVVGSITRVKDKVRFAAWVYEGVTYKPTPFLCLTADPEEMYYWLERCIIRLYEKSEVI